MLLIIPAERRLNWSRPPVITLGLILLNVLVFFIFQANENKNFNKAIDYYLDSPLVALEYPLYYRLKNPKASKTEILNAQIQANDIQHMLLDNDWNKKLEKGLYSETSLDYANWKQHREHFEKLMGDVSYFSKGLRPAKFSLFTSFSHMFLHGDGWHLFGNMVFLLIFGFSLEIILGAFKYLGLYLLSGFGAGVFFTLMNSDSYIPLVGASGAISGLMGCYAIVYGLKKIQFFYWIVVRFGYIQLPALMVLPMWLLKEIWEYATNPESNVAYMAHVGGLLTGALLTVLLKLQSTVNEEYLQGSDEDDARDPISEKLEAALEAMRRLNFTKSRSLLLQIIKQQPSNIRALELLYSIEKLNPQQKSFNKLVNHIFEVTRNERDLDEWSHQLYLEFRKLSPQGGLPLSRLVELCSRFSRSGFSADAEAIIQLIEGARPDTEALPDMILNLSNFYIKNNQRIKARDWLLKMEQQYSHSPLSKHASVMLDKLDANQDI